MRYSIISAICLAASAIAAPTVQIRQSSTECGNNYYSSSQVNAAFNQGLNYYYDGEQVGSDDYPHQYNNYEVSCLEMLNDRQELMHGRASISRSTDRIKSSRLRRAACTLAVGNLSRT
jgi:hypothetical protein